jgi:hypothetical protein
MIVLFACLALWSLPKIGKQCHVLNGFGINGRQCTVAGSIVCKLRCGQGFFMLQTGLTCEEIRPNANYRFLVALSIVF